MPRKITTRSQSGEAAPHRHSDSTMTAAGTGGPRFGSGAGALRPAGLLAATLLAACHKGPPPSTAAAPLSVSVTPVRSAVLKGGVVASGLLIPRLEAAVSSQLSGYSVARVLVDQDADVVAGQPLALLDDTLLRAQIAQQKAVVDQQKVASERMAEEVKRVAGLDNQGVLPEEQILERRLSAKSAVASVGAAQAQLDDLMTRERMMTVRSPVGGLVLARTVRPGDIVGPTSVMYRVADGDVMELNAEVPEADLAGIHAGDHASVSLPDNSSVDGVVRVVSPEVDSQTKLGHVRVTLPVRPDLRPGGYGRATFAGSGRLVTVIPESALRFDADGASVMTLVDGNKAHRVPVRTGSRANGLVELLSGPPPGATVLLGGGAFVLDGDTVRPVRADPAAS